MSSIKECTLAFFKGLAFGKGLIMGRELAESKDMAEDRWITIHPFGWKQGEADTGEGKRYYQRIFINDETDEIEGGLGGKLNGTKIKDLGKKLKELRDKKGGKSEGTGQAETQKTEENDNLSDLARKIKALTDGKEYTEEVANKVGDLLRQELEKNKDYSDLVRRLDLARKYQEEHKKSTSVYDNKNYKDAKDRLEVYRNELIDKWEKGELKGKISEDPKYIKLCGEVADAREAAINDNKNAILKKLGVKEEDRAFVLSYHPYWDSKKVGKQMSDIIREQLKDVIDFNDGNNIKCSKAQKSNVENGLAMYSKEFVNALEARGIDVKTLKKGGRSYFTPTYKEVHITLDDTFGTVAHEFAHAIENSVPKIRELEKEFYDRRTKGEESRALRVLTGDPNYDYREYAKPDKFLHVYMGKDYSSRGAGHDYELLSMGMTYLYDRPDELTKDKDYMNFVLGCLAYKG